MPDKYLSYRIRILPEQLERARRRLQMLEREAARYGMFELLDGAEDGKRKGSGTEGSPAAHRSIHSRLVGAGDN